MRMPAWLRCLVLRFRLHEERSRLSELLGQECLAQMEYAMTSDFQMRARRAEVVANLAHRIAASRARLSQLRKSIFRITNGIPEGAHGHV